jgi:hypothetical protein
MKGGLGFDPVGDLRATAFQRRFASFMDDKLRQDPENYSKIAIISNAAKRNIPSIRHNPKFIVQPKYGPYEQGVVKVQDTTIKLPPLAARLDFDTLNDFTSEMRVRHPKKKTLEEFRSRNWRQQNGAIYRDRYRLMEYIGVRPIAPQGFVDGDMCTLRDVQHDFYGDRSSPSTSSEYFWPATKLPEVVDDAGLPHRPSTDHVNMEDLIQFSDSDDSESDDDLH